MKPNRFPIKIDTVNTIKNEYFEVVAGDHLTNILEFEITQQDEAYSLSGLIIEIDFSKPDRKLNRQDMNTGVEITDEENGKVSCLLASNSINVQGRIRGEVKILEGAKLLTSKRFEFFVRNPLVTDSIVESTTELPILVKLISKVDELVIAQIEMIESELERKTNDSARQLLHEQLLQLQTNLEDLKNTVEETNNSIVLAENTRELSEVDREDNEILRERLKVQLETLQGDLERLVTNATDTIDIANQSATDADNKADLANTAAQNTDAVRIAMQELGELLEQAESLRITGEDKRNTNETERILAEQTRETNYIEKIDEFVAETERVETIYPTRLTKVENDLAEHKLDYANLANDVKELSYITQKYTIDSWQKVQELVRAGLADKAFRIGDQLVANYNGTPYIWDVIGINHDTPTDTSKQYSLTIQAHDCIINCQFDAPEWLHYAETELAAGRYYFYDKYSTTNYEFTTTVVVPVDGTIDVTAWGESEHPSQIKTYDTSGTTLETLALTETASPTGTLVAFHDLRRVRYGSNNYTESNIKQWLNSPETIFTWTKKSKYSKPSVGAPYSGSGFLKLLDPELASVIGQVDKQVARNNITDSGGQDLFSDKVFLLSNIEVFAPSEGVTTGEKVYSWYSSLGGSPRYDAIEGRIKYLSGSTRYWWLRSPIVGYSYYPRSVYATGYVGNIYASSARGLAPACCII